MIWAGARLDETDGMGKVDEEDRACGRIPDIVLYRTVESTWYDYLGPGELPPEPRPLKAVRARGSALGEAEETAI